MSSADTPPARRGRCRSWLSGFNAFQSEALPDTQTHGHTDSWTHGLTDSRTHRLTDTWSHLVVNVFVKLWCLYVWLIQYVSIKRSVTQCNYIQVVYVIIALVCQHVQLNSIYRKTMHFINWIQLYLTFAVCFYTILVYYCAHFAMSECYTYWVYFTHIYLYILCIYPYMYRMFYVFVYIYT